MSSAEIFALSKSALNPFLFTEVGVERNVFRRGKLKAGSHLKDNDGIRSRRADQDVVPTQKQFL